MAHREGRWWREMKTMTMKLWSLRSKLTRKLSIGCKPWRCRMTMITVRQPSNNCDFFSICPFIPSQYSVIVRICCFGPLVSVINLQFTSIRYFQSNHFSISLLRFPCESSEQIGTFVMLGKTFPTVNANNISMYVHLPTPIRTAIDVGEWFKLEIYWNFPRANVNKQQLRASRWARMLIFMKLFSLYYFMMIVGILH